MFMTGELEKEGGATHPVPRGLDRANGHSLWVQVRDDLALRIAAGEFTSAGAAFPGEMSLSAAYGVSRQTVRQALRSLRDDGVLIGERGRPPTVADPASLHQPLGALYSLHAAAVAQGLTQRSVVRALEITYDPSIADLLHLPATAALLHLERIRLIDDEPLAHDHAWLPAALTRALLAANFEDTALYSELAGKCGIRLTGGSEQIHSVILDPAESQLLDVEPGSAGFFIERVGRINDSPTEIRRTLVRGDRFTVSAEYGRAGFRLSPARALHRDASPPDCFGRSRE